jgi:competence protein ComEC
MNQRHAPLLLPALAFAGGAAAGLDLPRPLPPPPIAALALLVLLSAALGRRAGRALAWAGLGLLVATLREPLLEPSAAGIDLRRPADLLLTVTGHPTPEEDDGWSAAARVEQVRQGPRVVLLALPVVVYLPGLPEAAENPVPAFGSRLRVRGILSRSAGFANRVAVPPGPWRLRVKSWALAEVERGPRGFHRFSAALRRRVERAFAAADEAADSDSAGVALARALVLGDASQVPQAWKRGLRRTGTYHLLSVSGVHVALAGGVVWLLAGALPRRGRYLAALGAIGLYLLVVGPLPALVRAAVMGALAIASLLAERPPAATNALACAVLLLVAHRPEIVHDLAFDLSVSATFGLIVLGPRLAERWTPRLPGWLARALAASVGAELAALPWTLTRFHGLALLAPLVNLAAIPWTGVVLTGSFLWAGIALVAPRAAAALVPLLDALAAPFGWPGQTRPQVWGAVPVLASPLAAVALTLALVAVLSWRRWRLAVAAVAASTLFLGALKSGPRRGVELVMLDVGQGDSVLLRDGRRAVLVDGGGWRRGDIGSRVLLPALLGEGIRRLDALVMTHPDDDHCRGLLDVAAHLPVAEVWMGPGWDPGSCAGSLAGRPAPVAVSSGLVRKPGSAAGA